MKLYLVITSNHTLAEALQGPNNGFDCTFDLIAPAKSGNDQLEGIDRAFKRAQAWSSPNTNVWVVEAFTYADGGKNTGVNSAMTVINGIVREGKGTNQSVCAVMPLNDSNSVAVREAKAMLVRRMEEAGFEVVAVGGEEADKSTTN